MKYRAVIKKVDVWWIGWLIDLPGVNAQEKTQDELLESLRIGAQDMLDTEIPFEPDAQMRTIEVPDPSWAGEGKELRDCKGEFRD
jgi:predicted RNase H-like HicB family nuclease